MDARIGVLALQGDVSEHVAAFAAASGETVAAVRRTRDFEGLEALAIPGGESTTITRLIDKNDMRQMLLDFEGGIFATCAGMVLMATRVDDPRVRPLGLIEMSVNRNAFGRQRDSFEADLTVEGLDRAFHAIFIRAPVAVSIGGDARALAAIETGIVAVMQGKHLALSFHPELSGDLRLHRLFLENLGIC